MSETIIAARRLRCTTVPALTMIGRLIDPNHVEWNRGFHRFPFRLDDLAGIDHVGCHFRFSRFKVWVAGASTHALEGDTGR